MLPKEIEALMNSGSVYYESDLPDISQQQAIYRDLLFQFNHTLPSEMTRKNELLQQLLGSFGAGSYIEQPLHANWGKNTYFGKNVYVNFSLTLVDDAKIEIHDDVMIGPNVTLSAGTHPLSATQRLKKGQYNLPIVIERNV